MRRWRGHGWSRLSHGVHTGGGRARITVTLVSVGPHNIAGFPSPALFLPPPVGPARCSELLNKLTAEAACFFARRGKTICSRRSGATALKGGAQAYRAVSVYGRDSQ